MSPKGEGAIGHEDSMPGGLTSTTRRWDFDGQCGHLGSLRAKVVRDVTASFSSLSVFMAESCAKHRQLDYPNRCFEAL